MTGKCFVSFLTRCYLQQVKSQENLNRPCVRGDFRTCPKLRLSYRQKSGVKYIFLRCHKQNLGQRLFSVKDKFRCLWPFVNTATGDPYAEQQISFLYVSFSEQWRVLWPGAIVIMNVKKKKLKKSFISIDFQRQSKYLSSGSMHAVGQISWFLRLPEFVPDISKRQTKVA